MDQELKQRLIGAVVITALAAIFVPMLFDDPIEESGQLVNELALPEPPVQEFAKTAERLPDSSRPQWTEESVDEAEPDADEVEGLTPEELEYIGPVDDGSELKPIDKKKLPSSLTETDKPTEIAENAPVSEVRVPKTESAETLPIAELVTWYIQPGSFSKKDNAFALRDKLRSQGFPAAVEEIDIRGGKSYRVLVGPETDKSKAQALKTRLDADNNLKSLLLSVNKPKAIEPSAAAQISQSAPQQRGPAASTGMVKWYIQLGSFSKQENADSLRDKLRAKGFPAAVTEVDTAQGKAYRLRVGPELDKKRAETQLMQLDSQHSLKGFLVSE
ncbi:SPOR domain-containing protein [Methylotuvimicrobium sp. KM1]|uniref:SPOR domain-containing protein n=1 Tax=Methylotuvimicrobium sp. KM1 TaxID=3377707 RepID=UPI00385095BF